MSSLTTDKSGNRRIQFIDRAVAGGRRTIALGTIDKKTADGIRGYVERLANVKRFGLPIDLDAAAWLSKTGDELHDRIANAGIAAPCHDTPAVTVASIIDTFTLRRGPSVKAGTKLAWAQARRHLLAAFDADKLAADITPADADDFRRTLRAEYSEAYTAKMVIAAKSFFRDAVWRQALAESPFTDTPTGSQRNPDRARFIDATPIAKCIEAAPDTEWRLLIVLAR